MGKKGRTVLAGKVGETENVGLAAKRSGERTADTANITSGDRHGLVALVDSGSVGEAHEGGNGDDGELHFEGWLVGWFGW